MGWRLARPRRLGTLAAGLGAVAAGLGAVAAGLGAVGCGGAAAGGEAAGGPPRPTVTVPPAGAGPVAVVAPAPTGPQPVPQLEPFEVAQQEMRREGDLEVSLEFPSFTAPGGGAAEVRAAGTLSAVVHAELLAQMEAFGELEGESRQNVAAGMPPFSLAIRCQVTANTGALVSMACSEHSYTGGAHGNQRMIGRSYRVEGDEVRRLGLDDLFRDPAKARAWLSAYALKELRRQGAYGVAQGTITDLSDLIDPFAIADGGLALFFPPYSVAPYAAGEFTVIVPHQALRPLLTPGSPVRTLGEPGEPDAAIGGPRRTR